MKLELFQQAVEHSLWPPHILVWLANLSLVSLLVAAVALVFHSLLHRHSPRLRCNLLAVTMAVIAAAPLVVAVTDPVARPVIWLPTYSLPRAVAALPVPDDSLPLPTGIAAPPVPLRGEVEPLEADQMAWNSTVRLPDELPHVPADHPAVEAPAGEASDSGLARVVNIRNDANESSEASRASLQSEASGAHDVSITKPPGGTIVVAGGDGPFELPVVADSAARSAGHASVEGDKPSQLSFGLPAAWQVGGTLLGWVWLLVAVMRMAGLCRGYRFLRRLRASLRAPSDSALEQLVESICRGAGCRRVPQLCESNIAPVPLTFGLVRPRIVLPAGMADRLSAVELELILRHEVAHVRRGDPWMVVGEVAVQWLFWWNPLVRRIANELSRLREQICDQFAVDGTGRHQQMARLLVQIAERSMSGRCAPRGLPGFLRRTSELEWRVWQLTRKDPLMPCRSIWKSATLCVLFAALVAAGLVFHPLRAAPPVALESVEHETSAEDSDKARADQPAEDSAEALTEDATERAAEEPTDPARPAAPLPEAPLGVVARGGGPSPVDATLRGDFAGQSNYLQMIDVVMQIADLKHQLRGAELTLLQQQELAARRVIPMSSLGFSKLDLERARMKLDLLMRFFNQAVDNAEQMLHVASRYVDEMRDGYAQKEVSLAQVLAANYLLQDVEMQYRMLRELRKQVESAGEPSEKWGAVTDVRDGYCEVSLGSEDGVQVGQKVVIGRTRRDIEARDSGYAVQTNEGTVTHIAPKSSIVKLQGDATVAKDDHVKAVGNSQ